MDIPVNVVKRMVQEQFPEWSEMDIRPVANGGIDNRTFHLGEDMAIRLPSHKKYEPQVEKEAKWLPKLALNLSMPITVPVGKGKPTKDYPFAWSINKWVAGDTVKQDNVDLNKFAKDLARFLNELEGIDASDGPIGGAHNQYRGGNLSVYHQETLDALELLSSRINIEKCTYIWKTALSTQWMKKPVWVHGDIAQGNLIAKKRRLSGVIDFGASGTGDPACDLVIAWTFFDKETRSIFMDHMELDKDTWNRARGWALWKALITFEQKASQNVIDILSNEI